VTVVLIMGDALDVLVAKAQIRCSLPTPANRRLIRESAKLTQADLAAALGVDRVAVSRWERGESAPRGNSFERYATLLDRLRREVLST
jgi:DNA-binding transcriptional regulator YiaG